MEELVLLVADSEPAILDLPMEVRDSERPGQRGIAGGGEISTPSALEEQAFLDDSVESEELVFLDDILLF